MDNWQGLGTDKVENNLAADNIRYTALNNNYWSPLTKQADDSDDDYYVMNVEQQQKIDPRWEKILEKRRQRLAILDSGATSGAAGEEDGYGLIDTGQPSNKTFMFPNIMKQKATK